MCVCVCVWMRDKGFLQEVLSHLQNMTCVGHACTSSDVYIGSLYDQSILYVCISVFSDQQFYQTDLKSCT